MPCEIPRSAAHAVLTVDDLQEAIFPLLLVLDNTGQPKNGQRDLKNLAVTGQAFLEVALNVVWRHVSFGRLIQVWKARGVVVQRFPDDYRSDSYPFYGNKSREMVFKRPPSFEDWQRFEYYARRIHQLRLHWLPLDTGFSNDFADAILERTVLPSFQVDGSPPPPIFPKLNSLEWNMGKDTAEMCVCTAIINESPVLDSFAALEGRSVTDRSNTFSEVFASLGRLGTPLKSLVIRRDGLSHFMTTDTIQTRTHSLAQLITRSELQELVIPSVIIPVTTIMKMISALPTLKTLGVTYHQDFPTYYKAPGPQNTFPSLECLKGDFLAVRSLLTHAIFPSLTRLAIPDPGESSFILWETVRETVRIIGESCPALEVLHISTKLSSGEWNDASTLEWPATSVFAPLQACHRLKDVQFDFFSNELVIPSLMGRELDLSDEQWEQLALAWPCLVSIWFGAAFERDRGCVLVCPRPRATLRTIATFFKHCSHLSICGIPVVARGEDAKAALEEVLPRKGPAHLDFKVSWINKGDRQDIAIFLAALAPHPETFIQTPVRLSQDQYIAGGGQYVAPEKRAMEFARCNDWQGIEQLVESARSTRQP